MIANDVLCSVCTYKRYDTTLSLSLMSIANQTVKPHKVIIFDDNDDVKDLRQIETYRYIFNIFDIVGIKWEVVFGRKKGQHHSHQIANTLGYKWVWRLDDDTVAESNVLENLLKYAKDDVGAIGGSVLTPPLFEKPKFDISGLIENITIEPNIQWFHIDKYKEVEHLHCSFLYRAGVANYNLGLSKVAHREETLFTWELHNKGYKILVIPNTITWHLKNSSGGIRSVDNTNQNLYENDEKIFRNIVKHKDKKIVVLDCGMGDHIVFKRVLKDLNNPIIFTCYPEIIPGRSIAEAIHLFGDIGSYNIYRKMDEWNWKGSLESAFRKMYLQ